MHFDCLSASTAKTHCPSWGWEFTKIKYDNNNGSGRLTELLPFRNTKSFTMNNITKPEEEEKGRKRKAKDKG